MEEETPRQHEKKLLATVAGIQADNKGRCRYPYRQLQKLRDAGFRQSQGVCFALCLDWLRRRMWNVFRNHMKPKRNLNDASFRGKHGKELTAKHHALQETYSQAKDEGGLDDLLMFTILQKMADSNVVKGMGRLEARKTGHIAEFEVLAHERSWGGSDELESGWDATAVSLEGGPPLWLLASFKEQLDGARALIGVGCPVVGLLIELVGKKAHAVVLLLGVNEDFFFDPNIGEYSFAAAEGVAEVAFITDLWWTLYRPYFEMTSAIFSIIRFRPDA